MKVSIALAVGVFAAALAGRALGIIPALRTGEINWQQTIHGDGVTLHRVTADQNDYFHAVCKMYTIDSDDLVVQLKSMVLWCVCDEKNIPVGAIHLESIYR